MLFRTIRLEIFCMLTTIFLSLMFILYPHRALGVNTVLFAKKLLQHLISGAGK